MLLLALAPVTARAEETPEGLVRKSVDEVLTVLREPTLQGPAHRRDRLARVRAIADRVFDWQEMARRSLGGHARLITPAQRDRYLVLFRELLADKYMDEIDSFDGREQVTVKGARAVGEDRFVETFIVTAGGDRVPIEYYMQREAAGWRVFDFSIEGVSMVAHYRDTFGRFLVNATFDDLLARLEERHAGRVD